MAYYSSSVPIHVTQSRPEMTSWTFGVEIEVVVRPHKLRSPLDPALYYAKLAASLEKRGLKAAADDLRGRHRRRSEHYDKWWITRDGSLGQYSGAISMEAVSPILEIRREWEREIKKFWEAMSAVFHMPEEVSKCGSHVHVAPGRSKRFTLSTLKTIAYGVALYEPLVLRLLLPSRANNEYCQPNSRNSDALRQHGSCTGAVARLIGGAPCAASLVRVMQNNRYVVWNFENVLPDKSGTIEFRGGRLLKGEIRTKRWITFAVCFLRAVVDMDDLRSGGHGLAAFTPEALYQKIRTEAARLGMHEHLPATHTGLNEAYRFTGQQGHGITAVRF